MRANTLLLLTLALVLVGGCGPARSAAPTTMATAPTPSPVPTEAPSATATPRPVPSPAPTQTASRQPGQTAQAGHELGDMLVRPTDGMRARYVPAGTFAMGSTEAEVDAAMEMCRQYYSICNRWYYASESPQHDATQDAFWIDETEVTNAQYRLCVEAGACQAPTRCGKGEPTYQDAAKAGHPVVCVDWEGARAYCEFVGARLPTEAEWEYAARGKAGSRYPWGDEFDGTKLNYCDASCPEDHADVSYDDGFARTAPVGSFPQGASWCGALDMAGNVFEWVADWLGGYSGEPQTNPTGPASGTKKVTRGCSWFYHPARARGAARESVPPDTRFDSLGFRCVVPAAGATR